MNQERKEQLITLFVDGRLSDDEKAEWEKAVAEDPSLREQAEAASEIANLMRSEIPASQEPPYPEFFNSQVLKRIRDEAADPSAPEADAPSPFSLDGVLSWIRSPLTLAAAAVIVLSFVVKNLLAPPGTVISDRTIVQAVYAPDAGVEVSTTFDEGASACVILLDGLAAIPEDVEVSGKTVAYWEPVPDFGKARFFDEEGRLVYLLYPTPAGLPNVVPVLEDI